MTYSQLTYKNVLTCRANLGDIRRMYDYAIALGYPYFLWNDRVYQAEAVGGGIGTTKWTVSDIKEHTL